MNLVSLLAIFGLTHFVSTSGVMQWFRDLMAKVPVLGSVVGCWFTVCALASVLVYSVSHLLGGVGEMATLALASASVCMLLKDLSSGAVSFLTKKGS